MGWWSWKCTLYVVELECISPHVVFTPSSLTPSPSKSPSPSTLTIYPCPYFYHWVHKRFLAQRRVKFLKIIWLESRLIILDMHLAGCCIDTYNTYVVFASSSTHVVSTPSSTSIRFPSLSPTSVLYLDHQQWYYFLNWNIISYYNMKFLHLALIPYPFVPRYVIPYQT